MSAARVEADRATRHTAQVMANPNATMGDRLAAAEAEEAAIYAWRNQPEIEGAHADLGAGLAGGRNMSDWQIVDSGSGSGGGQRGAEMPDGVESDYSARLEAESDAAWGLDQAEMEAGA